jgi:DNA-binding GntR family transcriptional regulator
VMEKRMLQGQGKSQELWKQCDWDFHHALISACGSDVLLSTHALIYDRYLRYQMIAVVFRGEIAAREHQALLESALNRDWKKAQTIMISHIQGCVDHALKEDHAGLFSGASQMTAPKAASEAAKSKRKSKSRLAMVATPRSPA